MDFIFYEALLISTISGLYSIGFGMFVLFGLILVHNIVDYFVWPTLYLRLLHAFIWFMIGSVLGYYIGFFAMYTFALLFSAISIVVQNYFWKYA